MRRKVDPKINDCLRGKISDGKENGKDEAKHQEVFDDRLPFFLLHFQSINEKKGSSCYDNYAGLCVYYSSFSFFSSRPTYSSNIEILVPGGSGVCLSSPVLSGLETECRRHFILKHAAKIS